MKFPWAMIVARSCGRIVLVIWLTWVLALSPLRPDFSRPNLSPSFSNRISASPRQTDTLAFTLSTAVASADNPFEMDEDDDEAGRQLLGPQGVWFAALSNSPTKSRAFLLSESPPPPVLARLRC